MNSGKSPQKPERKPPWLVILLGMALFALLVVGLKRPRYVKIKNEEKEEIWSVALKAVKAFSGDSLVARVGYRSGSNANFLVGAALIIGAAVAAGSFGWSLYTDIHRESAGWGAAFNFCSIIPLLIGVMARFSEINPGYVESEFASLLVKTDKDTGALIRKDDGSLIPLTIEDVAFFVHREKAGRSEHQREGLWRGRIWSVRSSLLMITGLSLILHAMVTHLLTH